MIKRTLLSLLTVLLVSTLTHGQRLGVGFAYATTNAMNAEILYVKDDNNFKLGASFQFSDTRGKLVNEQLSNYGRTVDGTGKYFLTVDLGYGKQLGTKIQVDGEVSIGTLSYYTNYIDNRFNGGGIPLDKKS